MFTTAEITVLEAITTLIASLRVDAIGMFESSSRFTLHAVLTYLWNQRKHEENFNDVLKGLCNKQYIIELPGQKYKYNGLCTCGRCSRWTPRERRVFRTKEAEFVDKIRVFGKELNWTDSHPIVCEPTPEHELKVIRPRKSKQVKPKTGKRLAKVVMETTVRLNQIDKLKLKALDIQEQIQELRGIRKRVAKKAKVKANG